MACSSWTCTSRASAKSRSDPSSSGPTATTRRTRATHAGRSCSGRASRRASRHGKYERLEARRKDTRRMVVIRLGLAAVLVVLAQGVGAVEAGDSKTVVDGATPFAPQRAVVAP